MHNCASNITGDSPSTSLYPPLPSWVSIQRVLNLSNGVRVIGVAVELIAGFCNGLRQRDAIVFSGAADKKILRKRKTNPKIPEFVPETPRKHPFFVSVDQSNRINLTPDSPETNAFDSQVGIKKIHSNSGSVPTLPARGQRLPQAKFAARSQTVHNCSVLFGFLLKGER